jgi:hypothetical protein
MNIIMHILSIKILAGLLIVPQRDSVRPGPNFFLEASIGNVHNFLKSDVQKKGHQTSFAGPSRARGSRQIALMAYPSGDLPAIDFDIFGFNSKLKLRISKTKGI